MKKLLLVLMFAFLAFFAVGCGDKSYSVTFMVDGAVYETADKITSGETAVFPEQPSKTGYRFTGWYEEGASEPFAEDSKIKENVVLYAGFAENEYTLNFDANGGTGSMDAVTLTYAQEYTLPACAFNYTDNLFAGWALTADGEVVYDDGESVSKLSETHGSSVTLYAVWDSQSYTVVFDGNGGLGKMDTLTVAMSREFSLTKCAFTRLDWHFAGWALSSEGEAVYTDGQKVKELADENGEQVTLYAVWEQDAYTVRFDKNDDAATGTMADQTFTLKEEKKLSKNLFDKAGYTFMGWALTAEGVVAYEDEELVSGLADAHGQTVTLYAVFKGAPETYTVIIKTETAQGSFDEKRETKNGYFDDVVTITADPKTGYNVNIDGNGVKLDGGNDTVITVTYSLIDYTAKLVGVYGTEEFDIDTQSFTYLSEAFSLEATDRVEVNGTAYRYIDKGVSLDVAKNTADNVTIRVEYGVEVKDAEGLVDAMQNHPAQSVVLANDIDMKNYLAAYPWNSTSTSGDDAFFNQPFSGTLDGKGYSVLNLNSTSGLVGRYTNVVFREISANGMVKNLHMQISIGISDNSGGGGERLAFLVGDMYGTIENCFFEVDAQYNVSWKMYGAGPFYNLAETTKVTDTVIYVPNPAPLRTTCSLGWGDYEALGAFENVAYVYGQTDYNNALPSKYNPNFKNIYFIRANNETGTFTDVKVLNFEKYTQGASTNTNSADYWDTVSFEDVTSAMSGFTFTETALEFGGRTIVDFEAPIEVSDAYEFVEAMTGNPWADIVLMNDIDMSDYLAEHPWNDANSGTGAFFNFTFTGTLDGQGYSILNLNATAGVVERWENVVFRELAETGVIKNLHLQASLGVQSSTGDRSYLFGNVYGTISNCLFEIYPETNSSAWDGCVYYGTGAIYRLKESALIENTVFYVPNPAGFRLIASNASLNSNTGASSYVGTFRNVAYIYGNFDYNNLLPTQVNPDISDIYIIKADAATNSFTEPKKLVEGYASGSIVNGAELWTETTLEAIDEAMTGFTFTETSISFGDTVIIDGFVETIEVTTAEQLVNSLRYKPWATIKLMNDIDMSTYLAKYPWNNTDTTSGAFINTEFTGTLDGQGHSILNLDSTAGTINRWEKNSLIRKISSTAVIKNLHLQVSIGINSSGQDRAFLIGNMEGTIENCFFEIDAVTNEGNGYFGTAAFYTLASTSVVRDTVFYISNPAGFRLMCASTGDSSRVGTFENVTYVYGSFDYNNLLPDQVNTNISGIYLIREDASTGTFTDAKALTADYAGGSTANGEALWTGTTVGDITTAMKGFTFTEKTLVFGGKVIKDFNVA